MISVLLLVSYLAEIVLLMVLRQRRTRVLFTSFSAVLILSVIVAGVASGGIALLFAVYGLYRLLNCMRILKERMHDQYLLRSVRRTSVSIALQQVILAVVTTIALSQARLTFDLMGAVFLIIAICLVYSLERTLQKSKWHEAQTHYSDKELPTVSVLVPARNETEDLAACLRSLLANDYPKLEILVLDDCSHDKTADIIKSFAHAGVRFVQGDEPSDRWLAKNQAYDKLLREANGEFLLFCGVDVRLGNSAVRALVTAALNRKKSMISVMPMRFYSRLDSAFIQPMRYWWELVPPRRLFNRPPVLSTCWLIRRAVLQKQGGFAAMSRAIIPEAQIARSLTRTDGYSFMIANKDLEVQTVKPLTEQRATAIRVRYPQLKRRPETVSMLVLAETFVLMTPYLLFLYAFTQSNQLLMLTSGLTCAALTSIHARIMQLSNPGNVMLALFNFPLVVIVELWVLHVSMLKYEFGTVIWKERNVCIPAMHVYAKLPAIDK